ncbi:MAG: histidinol dehydrogenase [Paracoccaceae bacterium]|nr:histidinol dehydrogenase [Paracoccaceae bacterium]
MPEYLKKAALTSKSDASDVRATVMGILEDIEARGDAAAMEYAAKFDGYSGNILLTAEDIEAATAAVPARLKDDIRFAADNVRRFAEAQKATLTDTTLEVVPGLTAGQKIIPVHAAGAYVPGGRYSHVASAIMTVTTAKVAGVGHVTACSPPRPDVGIAPAIVYAAHVCGADTILAMGGVQGVAAMAYGLFGLPKANILVGPGNQFVAEAKRILFGQVGIDMIAGPTDSLILADATADAEIVAADLVGQAEHGYNSPVWLVTDDRDLAERVMALVPGLIDDLPEVNRENATAAWRDYAEVILCADREEMAATSDRYAPEHLTVQAEDLDWWLSRLTSYGSLFLGEETTVAFGDKASGTNHVLPTSGAASYTGGPSRVRPGRGRL